MRLNSVSTATSTRMRASFVESTILQMALMQSEDDDRVRRAAQSSEESMKTSRKSRQSANKRALERSEGPTYGAGQF